MTKRTSWLQKRTSLPVIIVSVRMSQFGMHTQVQARSSLQRVLSLRQQLQPWSALQDVKEVDEQLRRLNRSSSREEGSYK